MWCAYGSNIQSFCGYIKQLPALEQNVARKKIHTRREKEGDDMYASVITLLRCSGNMLNNSDLIRHRSQNPHSHIHEVWKHSCIVFGRNLSAIHCFVHLIEWDFSHILRLPDYMSCISNWKWEKLALFNAFFIYKWYKGKSEWTLILSKIYLITPCFFPIFFENLFTVSWSCWQTYCLTHSMCNCSFLVESRYLDHGVSVQFFNTDFIQQLLEILLHSCLVVMPNSHRPTQLNKTDKLSRVSWCKLNWRQCEHVQSKYSVHTMQRRLDLTRPSSQVESSWGDVNWSLLFWNGFYFIQKIVYLNT